MQIFFPKFDKIGMPLLSIAVAALFVLETKYQLRKRTRPRLERLIANGGVAAAALPALRLLLIPVSYAVARKANEKSFGLLHWLQLPEWLKNTLGFLLLDYSNYLWHVLLHKSDLLWRFHNVHHIDLDLDLSTAWRFHVGENLASVPYRSGAVAIIGLPAPLLLFYEVVFEACTAFHHSNLKLPYPLERILCRIIVTPRVHGIHHSIVARETNSNFSVIFSIWDRLHKSLRLNVPQKEIIIGVPSYRDPAEQSIKKLFLMPFQQQRPWRLPDGTVPERKEQFPNTHLLP